MENRQERRALQFKKEHQGNNRKNTRGRHHQYVPLKDEDGILNGRTKLIRHDA